MATSAERRLRPQEIRRFGSQRAPYPIPDLTDIQTRSYERFLQYEIPLQKRQDQGIESVLREIFPIESYDKTLRLEYIRYELGKPRYEPHECRQLRLTYGRPFRVWLRLTKEQPIEEEVYLGDMPIMLGGGEFIINGAERVVVSQLHRSPGVDFVSELEAGDRRSYSCRVIPERGSWIELNTTKKDTISVRIDQSGKFSAMTLLRAMAPQVQPELRPDPRLLRNHRPKKSSTAAASARSKARSPSTTSSIPHGSDKAGEVILEGGQKITKNVAEIDLHLGPDQRRGDGRSRRIALIFNSLAEDTTSSHEEALLRIYQRLRPGNPPQLEKARALFHEKFFDTNRYRLGKVGRFRINRKLEPERARRRNDAAARRPDRRHDAIC